jgi:nucleotide-binding universal stress UspA family protein
MPTTTRHEVSFKEILVASDLSDASANAVNYAKAIARCFGSHIVLAHVMERANPIAIPEGGWVEEDSTTRVEQQVEAAGIALRAEGFVADAVNTYGSVKDEIQTLAEAHHADLIILGTHGRRGLNRLLSGSEAEGLFRQSDCPVLTVGPSAAPAPEEWAPKKVMCASSLSPSEATIVAYAYELAQSIGASFALLSVEDANQSSDDEQIWRSLEEALSSALAVREIGRHQIRSLLSGKSRAANIVDVARTLKTDLIVLGAKTAKFGTDHLRAGVLAQVLIDAPCPVLTIHAD